MNKSNVSKRWHTDIKELAGKYDFKLNECYDSLHRHNKATKCEFCGNNLQYVAVIDGFGSASDTIGKAIKHEIGMDCLTLVLGTRWAGYNSASTSIKQLKEDAAASRRKAEYAIKYKNLIDWTNGLPENYLSANSFVRDMKAILDTGSRPFTINMVNALVRVRDRFMTKHGDVSKFGDHLKHFTEVTIPKIKMILDLVCKVDGITHPAAPRFSAYWFVLSVYNGAVNKNIFTQKQADALNKVYVKYKKRLENKG